MQFHVGYGVGTSNPLQWVTFSVPSGSGLWVPIRFLCGEWMHAVSVAAGEYRGGFQTRIVGSLGMVTPAPVIGVKPRHVFEHAVGNVQPRMSFRVSRTLGTAGTSSDTRYPSDASAPSSALATSAALSAAPSAPSSALAPSAALSAAPSAPSSALAPSAALSAAPSAPSSALATSAALSAPAPVPGPAPSPSSSSAAAFSYAAASAPGTVARSLPMSIVLRVKEQAKDKIFTQGDAEAAGQAALAMGSGPGINQFASGSGATDPAAYTGGAKKKMENRESIYFGVVRYNHGGYEWCGRVELVSGRQQALGHTDYEAAWLRDLIALEAEEDGTLLAGPSARATLNFPREETTARLVALRAARAAEAVAREQADKAAREEGREATHGTVGASYNKETRTWGTTLKVDKQTLAFHNVGVEEECYITRDLMIIVFRVGGAAGKKVGGRGSGTGGVAQDFNYPWLVEEMRAAVAATWHGTVPTLENFKKEVRRSGSLLQKIVVARRPKQKATAGLGAFFGKK
jgi:hypothetical protein